MKNIVGDRLLLKLTIDKNLKSDVMGKFSRYNLSEDIFISEFNNKFTIKFVVNVKDPYLFRDTFGKEMVGKIFKDFKVKGVVIEEVYLKINEIGSTPYVFNYNHEIDNTNHKIREDYKWVWNLDLKSIK